MRSIATLPPGYHLAYGWYQDAQINPHHQYLLLYVSYSAWYSATLGVSSDREAIHRLKRRAIIWEEFLSGYCMQGLSEVLVRTYEHTQATPLFARRHWNGRLRSSTDWMSLIEYWYAVRCSVVHGIDVPRQSVWLAYDSLVIFMSEIFHRLTHERLAIDNVDAVDMQRFYGVNTLY